MFKPLQRPVSDRPAQLLGNVADLPADLATSGM
jgi:hypothetical protein